VRGVRNSAPDPGYSRILFSSQYTSYVSGCPYLVYKYNVSVNNTTLFIYNKNSVLSGRHVSTFIRSSSGPLGKQITERYIFQCIVGSQMLTGFVIWCEIRKILYIGICV